MVIEATLWIEMNSMLDCYGLSSLKFVTVTSNAEKNNTPKLLGGLLLYQACEVTKSVTSTKYFSSCAIDCQLTGGRMLRLVVYTS
jgi:hypothetical protein